MVFSTGMFRACYDGTAAESRAALLKGKKQAEAKGFNFETSRDAFVARAKKEGVVRIVGGLDLGVYLNSSKWMAMAVEAVGFLKKSTK